MYNVENYIEECLDSILKQSFDNYEVVLIDDESSDNTVEIVRKYVDQYDNFSLYQQSNGGASKARNNGIRHASGEYIFFLDSDDYLCDESLGKLINKLEGENYDILKFSAYDFFDGERKLNWDTNGYKLKGDYEGTLSGKDFLNMSIKNGDAYLVNCGHVLVRRQYILDNNLFFKEGIIHEDVLYHWELMIKANVVGVFNIPISCRRYRKDSVMGRDDWAKRIYAMYIIINETYSFLDHNVNITETDALWFLRMYAVKILQFYLELTKEERNSDYVVSLNKEVKKLMKAHKYWGKFNVRLFTISPSLYKCYHKLNQLVR